jgi:hypothetical protein
MAGGGDCLSSRGRVAQHRPGLWRVARRRGCSARLRIGISRREGSRPGRTTGSGAIDRSLLLGACRRASRAAGAWLRNASGDRRRQAFERTISGSGSIDRRRGGHRGAASGGSRCRGAANRRGGGWATWRRAARRRSGLVAGPRRGSSGRRSPDGPRMAPAPASRTSVGRGECHQEHERDQ